MTPSSASVHLALRSAGRQWELRSWREYYGLRAGGLAASAGNGAGGAADGPLTQHELAVAVPEDPAYHHLLPFFDDRSHTLLKPLGWQGDLCFSPGDGEGASFRSLRDASPAGPASPSSTTPARGAIRAYLAAYGPATADRHPVLARRGSQRW